MRRRNLRENSATVSLFPFLAVLVSTMGALLVLLVVMTYQARLQASQERAANAEFSTTPEPESERENASEELSPEVQKELLQLVNQQLNQSYKETQEELAQHNEDLSRLEKHIRHLQDKIDKLAQESNRMKQLGTLNRQQRASIEAALARLHQQIEIAVKELEKAQHEVRNRPKSYAIIPYRGPNQTYRRPLYIECRKNKVILQPEGITLTETDFKNASNPDNPLAFALRAISRYLTEEHATNVHAAQRIYPLLIIRPDGISEYYSARAAITSWGSDFGYEMVEQQWKLDFGKPDPELAEIIQRAVGQGRVRLRQLERLAPRHFRDQRNHGSLSRDNRPQDNESSGGTNRRLGTTTHGRPLPDGNQSSQRKRPNHVLHGNNAASQAAGSSNDPSTAIGRFNSNSGTPKGSNHGVPGGVAGGSSLQGRTMPSLAKTRGANWALHQSSARAIGYSRPIRIQCFADRLIVLTEKGQQEQVIPLGRQTQDAIEELVAAVRRRMKSWGSAGNDSFWRPVLVIDLKPGGQQRLIDLMNLLLDSGIELEWKQ